MLQFALINMEQTSGSMSPPGDQPQAHPSPIGNAAFSERLRGSLRREGPPLILIGLAVVIFFWPVISGQAWLPKGGGDSVSFIYPMYRFAADSLRSGTIPFWNPYQYAGAPFVADNQSGLFYPFNLLLFALWPEFSYRGIELLVIGHFFFAGAAMYGCLRLLQPDNPLRRSAAVLGALAFMFSDVFVTHIGNVNLIAVAAWLPLAFIGLRRAVMAESSRAKAGWAIGGGAALGFATLAGHGQITFLIALFLGIYTLYETVINRRLMALPLLGLLAVFAVALAGVSLFPAAETLQHTLRADFDFSRSTNYSLPLRAWPGLVAPDFFGRNASFWGDWLRVEVGYGGVFTLLMAVTAIVFRPTRLTFFFVGAGLFFLILAFGPATPLYPLLTGISPAIPFQVPARFVLLLNFCLAVLAAIGLDTLLGADRLSTRRSRVLLATTAVIMAGFAIALTLRRADLIQVEPERADQMMRAVLVFVGFGAIGWLLLVAGVRRSLPPLLLASAAIILLFADLYTLGRYVEIDWNDPMTGFAAESSALQFLHTEPGIDRIDIVAGAWQPNLPMIERLYAARGVYNPLEQANYNVYMGAVGYRGSPLYNVLGIKYVIGGKKEPPGDTSFIVPVLDDDPAVTVYLNTRALPRAMVLFNSTVIEDHDDVFDAIHADEFDPGKTVVLESGRELLQDAGQSTIEVTRYDENQAAFVVSTDKPAYFFLSDVYHPDWRATVNGVPAPIEVANYTFRAIYLEPGRHLITMIFRPSGWIAGVVATSIALFTLIMVIIRFVWSSGARTKQPASNEQRSASGILEEKRNEEQS